MYLVIRCCRLSWQRRCLRVADARHLLHYVVVVFALPSLVVFVAVLPSSSLVAASSLSSSLWSPPTSSALSLSHWSPPSSSSFSLSMLSSSSLLSGHHDARELLDACQQHMDMAPLLPSSLKFSVAVNEPKYADIEASLAMLFVIRVLGRAS